MTRDDARIHFEAVDEAATAAVEAKFGFYDVTDRRCNALYSEVRSNLLDERLQDMMMEDLMEFLYPSGDQLPTLN
ncbi:hypothetical protein BTHE68_71280 (plasmid) [Burkholderia sp. THE68]|uniref:hypothetical protein n=1 Tax=Burkholderia sp. THE68 TaxID=758782 RepID=UPI0013169CFB|nr:hypothetical protein [Burkholderia sp. THE68]BBU33394.1 hypothetical protein BTHE68_71280 [Burkholderia sp. THE68]